MKTFYNFMLAILLSMPMLQAQMEVDPNDLTSDLFLPKVENSDYFYRYYSDDQYCTTGLSWMQRQANVYQLRTEKSEVMTNKMLFATVVKAVRENNEGRILISDYMINLIKDNAYRDRLLTRDEKGIFRKNKEAKESPYREERLTYVGIQLPSLQDGSEKVIIKMDSDLFQTNMGKGGGEYRVEFLDSKGTVKFAFYPGASHEIEVAWLKTQLSIIRVYQGNTVIVETCYKVGPKIYDPETVLFPISVNHVLGSDNDNDGVLDQFDNCPKVYNPDQLDTDFDGIGDACDEDIDNDGVLNWLDNCVYTFNSDQSDLDGDGEGDACESDIDGDGVGDEVDNCIYVNNPSQEDMDGDGMGDLCDDDMDGDGVPNAEDNCVATPNPDQSDVDHDGNGDVCDEDADNDGILNIVDNCVLVANTDQADIDNDGEGDVCDMELDPTIDDDCLIQPTFSNEIFADQEFTVGPASSNPDLVINDAEDLLIFGQEGHPSIYGPVGGLNVDYYINPDRSVLKKPIILTDGIDFFGTRSAAEILASFGGNQMLQTIWDQGYDLVIVDYKGGADFMQRNAFAIQAFIRQIKEEYSIETIPAIIGPSMGGQIVRYALLDWEQNKLGEWGEHGIDVFLSADSPWEGANASPALAGLANQLTDLSNSMAQIDMITNSPAARQMLLNHYNDGNINTSGDPITYSPGVHPFRTAWMAELAAMGSAPTMCGHLLAIADGAVNGASSNVLPNATFLAINMTIDVAVWADPHPRIDVKGIRDFRRMLDGNNDMDDLSPVIKKTFVNTAGSLNMDSAPGSPFALADFMSLITIEDIPIQEWQGFLVWVREVKDISITLSGPSFAFIPTFSALGITGANPFGFVSSSSAPGGGFSVAGSPFEAAFFDGTDSGHNAFANGGDLPFFLGYVSGGEGNYSACEYLEDLVDAAPSILSQNFLEVDCNTFFEHISTECITQEFPQSSNISATFVGGNSDVEVNVSSSGVTVRIPPNLIPNPFYAQFEICLDISYGGCTEEICETLSIDLSGIPQDGCDGDFELQEEHEDTEIESRSTQTMDVLKVFPNPATNQFTLNNQTSGILEIYDVRGQKVFTRDISSEQATVQVNLTPNMYFVKFISQENEAVMITKLVIE